MVMRGKIPHAPYRRQRGPTRVKKGHGQFEIARQPFSKFKTCASRSGRIVEEGPCDDIFAAPKDAYLRPLLDAIPLSRIDPNWLGPATVAKGATEMDRAK
jgi:hypothetical protein